MEFLELLKAGAEIGLTAPVILGLGIIWQINKKFNHVDVRLSVLESHNRRCGD